MAPTATSARAGVLEHPDEAFAGYLADGVRQVVCEEKHMGSRAILLVCNESGPFTEDGPGALYTRTGRPLAAFASRTASSATSSAALCP